MIDYKNAKRWLAEIRDWRVNVSVSKVLAQPSTKTENQIICTPRAPPQSLSPYPWSNRPNNNRQLLNKTSFPLSKILITWTGNSSRPFQLSWTGGEHRGERRPFKYDSNSAIDMIYIIKDVVFSVTQGFMNLARFSYVRKEHSRVINKIIERVKNTTDDKKKEKSY